MAIALRTAEHSEWAPCVFNDRDGCLDRGPCSCSAEVSASSEVVLNAVPQRDTTRLVAIDIRFAVLDRTGVQSLVGRHGVVAAAHMVRADRLHVLRVGLDAERAVGPPGRLGNVFRLDKPHNQPPVLLKEPQENLAITIEAAAALLLAVEPDVAFGEIEDLRADRIKSRLVHVRARARSDFVGVATADNVTDAVFAPGNGEWMARG